MSKMLCAAVAAAVLLAPAAVMADPSPQGGGHGGYGHGGNSHGGNAHGYAGHGYGGPHGFAGRAPVVFRGRAYGRLSPYEVGVWRGGHWWHGYHGGRMGWWWFVDGGWYWYDAPVYPYPTDISETVMADAPPGVAPGGYTWWYCDDPQGYWPYVRACATPWQPAPPSPPPPQ